MKTKDQIEVVVGDITEENVDVIVNAANEALLPGGGVCGAIHRTAGAELALATKALNGCPVGQAKYTPGFKLHSKYVIHTVAPKYYMPGRSIEEKRTLLASCYQNSLNVAESLGVSSIAFPAVGTGVYGWPHPESAEIIIPTIAEWLRQHNSSMSVRIIVRDQLTQQIYGKLNKVGPDGHARYDPVSGSNGGN